MSPRRRDHGGPHGEGAEGAAGAAPPEAAPAPPSGAPPAGAPAATPSATSPAAPAAVPPHDDPPAAPLRLPELGTAEEILAALRQRAAEAGGIEAIGDVGGAAGIGGAGGISDVGDVGAVGPAALAPGDPEPARRIYSFADSLEEGGGEAPVAPVVRESWVVFELAGERYGLPVAAVREILRVGTITRVPHTPAPVRGIANLRGRVLAVVDLRVRLALPPAEIGPHSRILVVDSRHRTLGLLVDAALQVVKLAAADLEPPPADVMTPRSDYLLGVYQLDEQLIIALDLDRVLLLHEDDFADPAGTAAPALPLEPDRPGAADRPEASLPPAADR